MPAEIKEWIKKADSDYRVATREIAVVDEPSYDSVLFHCQQCIEKLLKAALIKYDQRPPKTHDLYELSVLLGKVVQGWSANQIDLIWLSKGATEFRYPGDSPDEDEARESFILCQKLRLLLLELLND